MFQSRIEFPIFPYFTLLRPPGRWWSVSVCGHSRGKRPDFTFFCSKYTLESFFSWQPSSTHDCGLFSIFALAKILSITGGGALTVMACLKLREWALKLHFDRQDYAVFGFWKKKKTENCWRWYVTEFILFLLMWSRICFAKMFHLNGVIQDWPQTKWPLIANTV